MSIEIDKKDIELYKEKEQEFKEISQQIQNEKEKDLIKIKQCILQNLKDIITDQYGNYVIQSILTKEGMDGQGPSDIFDLFTGGGRKNVKKKTNSVLQQMEVSLEDIYKGSEKYLEINRYRICKKCKGNGSKDPNANTTCPGCKGRGVKMVVQRMGNTILQSQQGCPDCRGEGYVIKESDKCTSCRGNKVNKESTTIKDSCLKI